MAEVLDKISDNIAGAYAARAGGTEDAWRQVMKAETWYRGEEAVAAGLADEVVPIPKRGAEPGQAEPGEDEPGPEMRQQFDLTAYGYQGPARTEPPKPEQPAEEPVTLTFNIGAGVDAQVLEALRAMAAGRTEPEPETVSEPAAPEQPTPETPTEPEPPAQAPEPEDAWAALTAHFTKDEPDAWSVLVSNLTSTTASSSAATKA
jgi:enoyl-CoA hydratase/carnithine racemase